VFAALLVPAGRLADHYGRRLFLLAGVVAFTLASVLCAVAPVLAVLVLGRVIQAAGAAMIVPSSLGLLLAAFPRRQHTLAVGIWAGVAAVAASSGAPVGGLLVAVDWRLIFLINVPIGPNALIEAHLFRSREFATATISRARHRVTRPRRRRWRARHRARRSP
jgi:MFS family permease